MKIVSGLLAVIIMGLMLCPALASAEPVPPDEPAAPEVVQPEPEPEPEPEETPHAEEPGVQGDGGDSGEGDAQTEALSAVRAERVVVTLSADVVFPGDSFQASCTIEPRDASQQVEWSTSSPAVSVDASGLARVASLLVLDDDGVYVDIWARATDGSLAMNCQTVHVMPAVENLSFFESGLTLDAGAEQKTAHVAVELAPAALYGIAQVEWSSSDPSIVAVSPAGMNGEVGLLSWTHVPGRAVVTARAAGASGASDRLDVVVEAGVD